MIPHLSGLCEIADRYDSFFLDIFGLLHNGLRLNPGTMDCLENLKSAGKKTCLVSNTPKMPDDVVRDLHHLGLPRSLYTEVVTAGASARRELEAEYRGKKMLFLGKIEFTAIMRDLNLTEVDTVGDADFILNSIPGINRYGEEELVAILHEAAHRQVPMVCANPDLVVHIGDILYKCAGTYAAIYEELDGPVSYHGKPYGQIYDMASDVLGRPPKNKICALGDALRTDIHGANAYGIDSVWALTGIHWNDLHFKDDPKNPDPENVKKTLNNSPYKPTATMTGFNW